MQMNEQDRAIGQRAETLRLSGAYDQAIEIFEQLLQKYPDNAWVNAHLGAIYCQLMDYGQAKDYLNKAIANNDKYLWAHAQLGETYRLLAIVNNRNHEYIARAIEHFKTSLDAEKPENSNYAWALAHLGATYRLNMTGDIQLLNNNQIHEPSKEYALKCLNRALELIPTYAWAWGMRATVYRLAKYYEDSFWDLGVETIIAPSLDILQNSSTPVPFLESRRVNLYEHAFLCFYLTKKESDPGRKKRHYARALAFLQQALILRPGDLIAKLIIIVIEAHQKKEDNGGQLDQNDISKIAKKMERFFKDAAEAEFGKKCQNVLRYLRKIPQRSVTSHQIESCLEKGSRLTELVWQDGIQQSDLNVTETEAQLWVCKNFVLTEVCSTVLSLLGDLSEILGDASNIGTAKPYRDLAAIIHPYHFVERLYQTPVLSDSARFKIMESASHLTITH
jgi:tetratricopeptide (TPR) repeat protein